MSGPAASIFFWAKAAVQARRKTIEQHDARKAQNLMWCRLNELSKRKKGLHRATLGSEQKQKGHSLSLCPKQFPVLSLRWRCWLRRRRRLISGRLRCRSLAGRRLRRRLSWLLWLDRSL